MINFADTYSVHFVYVFYSIYYVSMCVEDFDNVLYIDLWICIGLTKMESTV